MRVSKVNQSDQKKLQPDKLTLTDQEKKRLVDFFSLLIEINKRNKRKSNEINDN